MEQRNNEVHVETQYQNGENNASPQNEQRHEHFFPTQNPQYQLISLNNSQQGQTFSTPNIHLQHTQNLPCQSNCPSHCNCQQQGQNFPQQTVQQNQCICPEINSYCPPQQQLVSNNSQFMTNNMQMNDPPNQCQPNLNQYYLNQNQMRPNQGNQMIQQQPLQEQIRMFPEREPPRNIQNQTGSIDNMQNLNQQGGNISDLPKQANLQQVHQMQQEVPNQPQTMNSYPQQPITTDYYNVPQGVRAEVMSQYAPQPTTQPPTPQISYQPPLQQMSQQSSPDHSPYQPISYQPHEYQMYHQNYPQEFVTQQLPQQITPPQTWIQSNFQQQTPMPPQSYYQAPQPPQIVSPSQSEQNQRVQERVTPKTPIVRQESREENNEKKTLKSDTVQSLLQVDAKYFKPDPIQLKQHQQDQEFRPEIPEKVNRKEDTVASLMGAEQEYFANGLLREKYRIPIQREVKSVHNLSADHLKFCPHHHAQNERHLMNENQKIPLQPFQPNRQPFNVQKQNFNSHDSQVAPQQTQRVQSQHYQINQGRQPSQDQFVPSATVVESYRTPQQSANYQKEMNYEPPISSARTVQDESRVQTQVPPMEGQDKRQEVSHYTVGMNERQPLDTREIETEREVQDSKSRTRTSRFPTTIRQSSNMPADSNTYAEGLEEPKSISGIQVSHLGTGEEPMSKKKVTGQYGLNDYDVRKKVYKSAIVKRTDAQEIGTLEDGYPPQVNKKPPSSRNILTMRSH